MTSTPLSARTASPPQNGERDLAQPQTFDVFARESAYIHVNERMIARLLKRLTGAVRVRLLDIAAGTGLMSTIAYEQAHAAGIELQSTLLDFDLPALEIARSEVPADDADYVVASAVHLPFNQTYDAVIFANALHLLDEDAKVKSLSEAARVLKPGGFFVMNSTFYGGAYPEDSKPFYSRWIRRSISEINRRLPQRDKSEKVQAMEWLPAEGYRDLLTYAGFKIVEMRERRVLLSQAAVRAISSYKEFAKGALHATDDDAEQASLALQATVRQTFNELKMRYLSRNWLEIVAVKA